MSALHCASGSVESSRVKVLNIPPWEELVSASITGKDDPIPEGAKSIKEWAKAYNKSISQVDRIMHRLVENGVWECLFLNVTVAGQKRIVNYYRPKSK